MCTATREGDTIILATLGAFTITQGYENAQVWERLTLDEAQAIADTLLSLIHEEGS